MKALIKHIVRLIFITVLCLPVLQAQEYSIERLPFNTTDADEFSTAYYKNGFVFCSNRKSDIFIEYKTKKDEYLFDIYFVPQLKSNKWGAPRIFSKTLSSDSHEGPMCFTKDGSTIYFTRNYKMPHKFKDYTDYGNRLGIFISDIGLNGEWEDPTAFTHNDESYNFGHPCLNKNDKQLYFISDKIGGYGGTDIYVCEFKNGTWGKPVNLGAKINTVGDEMFPYIDENNRLYFSSNKHNSRGGLDVFYSEKIKNEWFSPVNLAQPINSRYDDFGFIKKAGNDTAYFSSKRKKNDDIYRILYRWPHFERCDSIKENNYCYIFYETGSFNLDTLPFIYEWDLGDGNSSRGLEIEHCYEELGEYFIQLNIVDTLTGDVFFNEASYNLVVENIEQVFINSPDYGIVNREIKFDGLNTNLKNFNIDGYYWNIGKEVKRKGHEFTHKFEYAGDYIVQLGVLGEDGKGNIRKSCTFKNITILKKYSEYSEMVSRIKEKPYIPSEEKPLKTNIQDNSIYKVEVTNSENQIPLDDAYFDNLQDYDISEIYIKEYERYSYTVGEGRTLFETYPVYVDVKSKGYHKAIIRNIALDSSKIAKIHTVLNKWTHNIVFEVNDFKIMPTSYYVLDSIATVLNKNSTIVIEIAAHTDNIGSDDYNLELSFRRAHAVVKYLESKGINRNRMLAKGYGEAIPITGNDTEEERSLNRRVEFTVITKE